MAYLLDANVFIQAKNLHYGFDFCPAFWDWLIDKNASKLVFSIEKVGDELAIYRDELTLWAAKLGSGFFLKTGATVLPFLSQVSNWVTSQQYTPAAVNTFLQGADLFLIANALALNYTVVTREVISDGRTKIKIPNVCIGLNVKCVSPFYMLRYEQAKFILER